MATLDGLHTPYFYLQLSIIHELRVFDTFSPFEAEFMATAM